MGPIVGARACGLRCGERIDTSYPPKRARTQPPLETVSVEWFGGFDNPVRPRYPEVVIQGRPFCLLGKGTYGCVILAQSRETGAFMVIKLVRTDRVADIHREATLTREAGYLATHTPVRIRLGSAEEITGMKCKLLFGAIPFEYCDGNTLYSVFCRPSSTSKRTVFNEIATQLVAMLRRFQKAGIAHADIVSTNVMVTKDGTVVPVDFGLAGRMHGDNKDSIQNVLRGVQVQPYPAHSMPLSVILDPSCSSHRWPSHVISRVYHCMDWWGVGTLLTTLFWNESALRKTKPAYVTPVGATDEAIRKGMKDLREKLVQGVELSELPPLFDYLPCSSLPTPMKTVIKYLLDAGLNKVDPNDPSQVAYLDTLLSKTA